MSTGWRFRPRNTGVPRRHHLVPGGGDRRRGDHAGDSPLFGRHRQAGRADRGRSLSPRAALMGQALPDAPGAELARRSLGGNGASSWRLRPIQERRSNRSAAATMKLWLRPTTSRGRSTRWQKATSSPGILRRTRSASSGLSMGGGTALAWQGHGSTRGFWQGLRWIPTPAIHPSAAGSGRVASTSTPWDKRMPVATMATPVSASPWRSIRLRWMFSIGARYPRNRHSCRSGEPRTDGRIPVTVEASDYRQGNSEFRICDHRDASHFSMFGECKLAPPTPPCRTDRRPICSDSTGASRRTIHAQLVDMIETGLPSEG